MKQLCIMAAVVAAASSFASAAVIGTDDANASTYGGGWNNNSDGSTSGDGFGAWSFNFGNTGNAGTFVYTSKNLVFGDTGADIDSAGKSFGMYGNNGGSFDATRSFNGALSVGQSFSLDVAVNYRNGNRGVDLRDGSGNTLVNFNVGGDDYVVNNATTGNGSVGNAYSDNTEFNLVFKQTSLLGGTWTITRSGGVSDVDTGTYTGLAGGFKLYINNADNSQQSNFYANNFSVVPEPAGMALLGGMGLMGLVSRRRSGK